MRSSFALPVAPQGARDIDPTAIDLVANSAGANTVGADTVGANTVDACADAKPNSSWSDEELFRALKTAAPAQRELIQDVLVRRNAGLVRWIAAQYANQAVDADELRQVGYLGLVLAIQRFDVDRGHDFKGFATPTVQGEIKRYFRDKRRWIRLPRRLQEAKATLRSSNEALIQRIGREPSIDELAEHSGLSAELVLEALSADDTFSPGSLDAPLCNDRDESFTVSDVVGDLDERFELIVDCDSIRPLIAKLPERQRRILHMRFYEEKTQAQIGNELGISQMQVSRLLTRTLDALRRGLAVT